MTPATLSDLKIALLSAKHDEAQAAERRKAIEEAILTHFDPMDEGSYTHKDSGITVAWKLTRSVDSDAVKQRWGELSLNAQKAFKATIGLDLKAYRALEEMDRESFAKAAQFVTTKPAKPAISIKE